MSRHNLASEPRETAKCEASIEWNKDTRRFRGECCCGWVGERRFLDQIKQITAGHIRIERKSAACR